MTTRHTFRTAALGAVTLSAALLLGACGGDRTDTGAHSAHGATATAAAHNAQDVAFAQGMIPHHQQALEMARLATGRTDSAQVKDLAARIEKAQDPEIRTMSGWLKSWGEQAPMAGMDHSAHTGMSGMMGADDMADLEKKKGAAFDSAFLSLMIRHHQGAVQMATTEKDKGRYAPATKLAGAVIDGQSAEIAEMKKLLDGEK
ncbi:DUF305 domain-containing protein [Streptomyces sp. SID4985]|uniref:DUF305 domain-containing protein n=1 Tax=unclassified Streptomyces TaxID=2593676 RepID=UPI00136ECD46|nr:DUF305 domain-containing protein [Streptomyces sp. SID4985]MYQ49192.1 DUF305 domain-containing protein [Streptomyces sp. SID4985]